MQTSQLSIPKLRDQTFETAIIGWVVPGELYEALIDIWPGFR